MAETKIVSTKLPAKISRPEQEWKPATLRGRRLAALLEKGRAEREPLLDDEGIARELRARRGGI